MQLTRWVFVFFALLIPFFACITHPEKAVAGEHRSMNYDSQALPFQRDSRMNSSQDSLFVEPVGTLKLGEALSAALERNPELRAFSWEVRARVANALQEGLIPNPEIGLEVENFGGQGEARGFETPETTLQLSQLIELGGKRSKRYQVASLETTLAEWDYETQRLNILEATTLAFVDVVTAQEQLRLSEQTLQLSEKVFNTVKERVRAGKVSPVEETKASVTVATSLIQVQQAKRKLTAKRKRMSAMWGSVSPRFEAAAGDLENVTPIPPAEPLDDLVKQNPDIRRWLVEMEHGQAAVDLEKARRIPNLTMSGGIRRFEETGDHAFVFGVSIPLPFFNRNQGKIQEEQSRLAKKTKERTAMEVRTKAALTDAYESLASSYSKILILKTKILPSAQSAFKAADEGYQQGKFGFLDVLDAQRTLFDAQKQYLEGLAEYHKSKARVERLIAQNLDDVMKTSQKGA